MQIEFSDTQITLFDFFSSFASAWLKAAFDIEFESVEKVVKKFTGRKLEG
jgi:hypothetical protein